MSLLEGRKDPLGGGGGVWGSPNPYHHRFYLRRYRRRTKSLSGSHALKLGRASIDHRDGIAGGPATVEVGVAEEAVTVRHINLRSCCTLLIHSGGGGYNQGRRTPLVEVSVLNQFSRYDPSSNNQKGSALGTNP